MENYHYDLEQVRAMPLDVVSSLCMGFKEFEERDRYKRMDEKARRIAEQVKKHYGVF